MIRARLLGNAQDAGLPQAGCACPNCSAAWADPARRRWACALGLLDEAAGAWFMIDATPDFREQWHEMETQAAGARCGGILLTHAHLGHYTGLAHLGYEAMGARGLPVLATPCMLDYLRLNAPWSQLAQRGNIDLRPVEAGAWQALTPALSIQALPVPHRDELSDTVAFLARGPRRQLLYLPDIDSWDEWERPIEQAARGVDVALLDATFFDADELPGGAVLRIGHPLAADTARRLQGAQADVRLIHLNHTNPLHRDGPERKWLRAQGLKVGEQGDEWEL